MPGHLYGQFQSSYKPQPTQATPLPVSSQVKEFWKNIWEVERCHNSSAEWLHRLQGKYNELQTQEDLSILQEDVTNHER